jgi:sugar lactone lactonase YvrE
VDLTNYYNQDGFSYDTDRSDGDYDNKKYTYPAELVNLNPSYDNVIYQLGPVNDDAKNTVAATGQTISLPQGVYSSIRFLSSATNGDKTGTFRIIYADNTYSDASMTIRDWCYEPDGHRVVQTMPHRHYPDGDRNGPNDTCRIFAYYLTPVQGKTVTGLKLPNNKDVHILAITLFLTIEDTVPPTTLHNYQYDGKWVNSPVQIQLTATDSDSGVKLVYYKLNDEAAVAGDVINIDNEGITTVQYWAVDNAGNTETAKTIEVKFDHTVPILTAASSPSPNSNGWHNADVTVKFNATDALSGIASVSQPVTVMEEGYNQTVTGTALDNAGNQAETAVTVNLDKTAPVINNLYPANGSVINRAQSVITAQISDNLSGIDAGTLKLTIDGNPVTSGINFSGNQLTYTPSVLSDGNHTIRIEAGDQAGNLAIPATTSFKIDASLPDLPPDPGAVAPQLNPAIVTDLKTATGFLYTGENPIQSGVDAETIEVRRAAVIRGKVLDAGGNPLPGVKITILNHSEYGHTYSRSDGMFDMAVNGGGYLTVNYEKAGYSSAQRQVKTPWQDYVWADEVRLVPYDTKVTTIAQNSADGQLAQGSIIRDERGERQATLFFPAGTTISGGSGGTVNVRTTEFTVGSDGPQKMPAALPATSAYTYCVDLSVDEADSVQFNKPIYFYVDNFLNFPVGGNVPTGYYDTDKGVWVPSDNGVIIRIVSVTDGLANIDVAGNGVAANADTLAGLGFTDAERRKLAESYSAGKTLWRVPIRHFSSWDCNWGWGPPADAIAPNGEEPTVIQDCPSPHACYIERETQVVRETTVIPGTPFTLNYSSDRVRGGSINRTLAIPLSGVVVPASLKRIELEVNIAGQHYTQSFSNATNQKIFYTWDGLDGYGRMTTGIKEATVSVGYVYDGSYQTVERFGNYGNGTNITGNQASFETTLWRSYALVLKTCPDGTKEINGWSLNVQHFYDSIGRVLYMGDGNHRDASNINNIIMTVAGANNPNDIIYSGEGGLATEAKLGEIQDIDFGPDGSLYIVNDSRILKVKPNGIITTIAGTGVSGYNGDGIAAKETQITKGGIVVGSDGVIYLADRNNYRIRKISSDGIITTIAGTGTDGFDGDGGLATKAKISRPGSVAIAPDGSIYFTDIDNHRIRRIGMDGIINTIAGVEQTGGFYEIYSGGDGGPANQAKLAWPYDMVIEKDGNLYFNDLGFGSGSGNTGSFSIRRISPEGIVTRIAGSSEYLVGYGGDGGPATEAFLYGSQGISVAEDGTIYTADNENYVVRMIKTDGIISTVAGNKYGDAYYEGGAVKSSRIIPRRTAIGPDGCLYIAEGYG